MTSTPEGRVVVLAGGLSPERDVSTRSGRRVAEALRATGAKVDVLDVG
jgi:D-alanine-D-alanine ligase